MNDAIRRMLERYELDSVDAYTRALREILQEVALLGLWRGRFFEHAAFYGGTALRILHGLDRFSEDLDFSLLRPSLDFDLTGYLAGLEGELASFGLTVTVAPRRKTTATAIQSAFLKAGARERLLTIHVDTDPPRGFETDTHFLLRPIPFSVRAYALPDLFAGKMHAVLFRRWKNRVKGRDWYDLVWFVTNHPALHLAHLEQRMRQSGDWTGDDPLTPERFAGLFEASVETLDVGRARAEVEPFVQDPRVLDVWSRPFFSSLARHIEIV